MLCVIGFGPSSFYRQLPAPLEEIFAEEIFYHKVQVRGRFDRLDDGKDSLGFIFINECLFERAHTGE